MFRLSLHAVLCLIVLACPAMGGMCCSEDAGLGQSTAVESPSCGGCCCGHDESEQSPPTESHDHCQTCLCGGALPVNSATTDSLPDSLGLVEYLPLELGTTPSSIAFLAYSRQFDHIPPYGRMMLTWHCALLL